MAKEPTLPDYVSVIIQLFDQFMQHREECAKGCQPHRLSVN